MGKILATRLLGSAALVICGAVVLGISAYVETNVRTLGVSTAYYTFDAFIGAFTIFVELVLGVVRYWAPSSKFASIAAEMGANFLLWSFWLAAGVATTKYTQEDRSICKNLDDLDNVPELDDFEQALLSLVKKAFKKACRDLKAELAFIWIAFAVTTALALYFFVLGNRKHKRIGRQAWSTPLVNYDRPATDPFSDPAGNAPAFGVGMVDEEDPDRK